jgi:acetoin utilization deacetylase AcuC-like enzyme
VYDLTVILREWADDRCGGRLVSVLEGGYEPGATAQAVVQHVHALAGLQAA